MSRPLSVFALGAAALVGVSCVFPTANTGCAGVGYFPLYVSVRDEAGVPSALGAIVTLYDGTYVEKDSASRDALQVVAADSRGGRTYDIQVTKPFYRDVWVPRVQVPGGGCVSAGDVPIPITVPVTLKLAPGAPRVRSLHLLPPRALLDRAPYITALTFTQYLDADVGVSHAVLFSIVGDTGSVGFNSVTGALSYRCLEKSGYLTLTARSAADTTVFATAAIAVQGHPAVPGDAPCT